MRDFKALNVWRKAHQLTLAVYKAAAGFSKEEMYGLTSQIRRAASSVPTNIAEGCGRGTTPDFARFLHIALGSASELEYHLILTHDLGLLPDEAYQHLTDETIQVKKMLAALIQKAPPDK